MQAGLAALQSRSLTRAPPCDAHTPHSCLSQHLGLRHSPGSTPFSAKVIQALPSLMPYVHSFPEARENSWPPHLVSPVTCPRSHLLPHHLYTHSLCCSHTGLLPLLPVSLAESCLRAFVQAEPLPRMLLLPVCFRNQLKCPQHPAHW